MDEAQATRETKYRNRRAVQIENDILRVTVLVEGGHVAEIRHKSSGVNPLWTPPWESIEPSAYDATEHPQYGGNAESKLLAGIMGHNLCLDLFGGPTPEEAAAGVTVHGEGSVLPYKVWIEDEMLISTVEMPLSGIRFTRLLKLEGFRVFFHEVVENLTAWDRPIAWTQHVTLGPPFLEHGTTQFSANVTKSRTFETEFGDLFPLATDFEWPHAPLAGGGTYDLRRFTERPVSAGFTTHLVNPEAEHGWFAAVSKDGLAFAYIWKRADFPWLGIWEENRARKSPPWNGNAVTRGMEFGASPMPESRRQMIERGKLFETPVYRWLPARGTLKASYQAVVAPAEEFAATLSA